MVLLFTDMTSIHCAGVKDDLDVRRSLSSFKSNISSMFVLPKAFLPILTVKNFSRTTNSQTVYIPKLSSSNLTLNSSKVY